MVNILNRIQPFFELVARIGAWFGGILLFLSVVLICIEVILRKVFTISLGGAEELSSYTLALSTSWGLAYALLRKAHIRIDVLYIRIPPGLRSVLDVASFIMLTIYMLPLTYFAFDVLQTSIARHSTANTPLGTPLWIPQSLWFAGLAVFTLTVLFTLTATVLALVGGDPGMARKLAGMSTLEEEIEEESGIRVQGVDFEKSTGGEA